MKTEAEKDPTKAKGARYARSVVDTYLVPHFKNQDIVTIQHKHIMDYLDERRVYWTEGDGKGKRWMWAKRGHENLKRKAPTTEASITALWSKITKQSAYKSKGTSIHTREEAKANMLGTVMERRIFPEGTFTYKVNDDPQDTETIERPYDDLRWQRLINFENREKMRLMDQHVFPFMRNIAADVSTAV